MQQTALENRQEGELLGTKEPGNMAARIAAQVHQHDAARADLLLQPEVLSDVPTDLRHG